MKLSHAVLRMRTAIAELTRAIGVGSGALLGDWSNDKPHIIAALPMLWAGIIVGIILASLKFL